MAGLNIDAEGLDAFLAGDGEVAPVAAEVSAVVPAAEVEHEIPAPVEPEVEAEVDIDDEGQTFDIKYVKQLRKQAQNYRDRAKQYNEVFDGYEQGAVQEWLNLASTLKADPEAAAERFSQLADAIRTQYGDEAGDAADAAVEEMSDDSTPDATDKPLTRAEFEQLMSERERQADLNSRVAKIEADAVTLGYQTGTDAYDNLLWRASRTSSGSIHEAHAHIKAEKQAVIDAYVAEMGGKSAPLVPSQGAPASGERELKTFDAASAALDEWLAGGGV